MNPEHAVPILAAVLVMGPQPRIATSVGPTVRQCGVTTRAIAEPRCAVHCDSDVVYRSVYMTF